MLAVMAALVFAGPAQADVFDDNPATASRGGGDLWVFARDAGGSIQERHWTGSEWSDWSSIGGNAASGPAAVGYGSGVLVFIRGADGAVWQNTYADGRWGGWASLDGYTTSAPAVTVRRGPLGYVDLVSRGGDNAIYLRTYVPRTGWSPWGSLGGNLTSAPAVNSQSDGVLNVWARGADGTVLQKAWNGAAWSEWGSIGGGIIGAPTAVSRAENVVNVYGRGAGNASFQRGWTATAGWGGWFLLDDTPLGSTPVAGGDSATHEWLVARAGENILFKEWKAASGWTSWNSLGTPRVASTPAAPTPTPSAAELELVAGLRCTPPGGRLRVNVAIRKPKSGNKARVSRIVFFTRGKNRAVRVDRKSPFAVRIRINRAAGQTGRVYARIYYRRSAKGKLHRKTISRRYVVCR